MAINVEFTVRNLPEVNSAIRKMDRRFGNMNILDFGNSIAEKAKSVLRAKYNKSRKHTGTLERSIHAVALKGGRRVIVIADAHRDGFPYGVPVELGRKGFSMRDRKLRFIGREGFPVYVTRVGPAEGKHFMQEAAVWGAKTIRNYMNRRIERIIQSGGRADDYRASRGV